MKKYLNYAIVIENFKNNIKEQLLNTKLHIDELDFEIGFQYIVDQLLDFSKKNILGLSDDETFLIRYFYGFNETITSYSATNLRKEYDLINAHIDIKRVLLLLCNVIKETCFYLERTEKRTNSENILLGDLNIFKVTFNRLRSHSIYSLGDLIALQRKDIIEISGIGKKGLEELMKEVHSYGLTFKDEVYSTDFNIQADCNIDSSEKIQEIDRKLKLLILKESRLNLKIQELELEKEKNLEEMTKLKLLKENCVKKQNK